MPPLSKRPGHLFAPHHFNTLNGRDSGDSSKRARPPAQQDGPSPKRLRVDAVFPRFGPLSSGSRRLEIAESSAPRPRSDHHGSTESMPNTVGGVEEYRAATSRTNRERPSRRSSRGRNPQGEGGQVMGLMGSHFITRPPGRPRRIRDEIEDDFGDQDELATHNTHFGQRRGSISQQNPPGAARPTSSTFGGDGADVHFYKKPPNRSAQARVGTPEEDEISVLPVLSQSEGYANPTSSSAGVSHRGDIVSTWKRKHARLRIPIANAFRHSKYRFIDQSGETDEAGTRGVTCFEERSDQPGELHASSEREPDRETLSWLCVKANKVQTVDFNEQSSYIVVRSATEPNGGCLLALELSSKQAVTDFVQWYERCSKSPVVRAVHPDWLGKVFEKTRKEVCCKIEQSHQPMDNARRSEYVGNPRETPYASSRSQHTRGSGLNQFHPRVKLIHEMKVASLPGKPATYRTSDEGAFPCESAPPAPPARTIRAGLTGVAAKPSSPRNHLPTDLGQQPRRSLRSAAAASTPYRSFSSAVTKTWTEENPDWAKDWTMPLVYHRTTVDSGDIPRLDEGQCLNDNLIGFGLRYLFRKHASENPDLETRIYLFNSFFYEKLKSARDGKINYAGVRNWTSKVDLFSYDYIVVPVNESFHWWVAIICNPGKLDPDVPRQSTQENDDSPEKEGVLHGDLARDAATNASPEVVMLDAPAAPQDPGEMVFPAQVLGGLLEEDAATTTNQPGEAVCPKTPLQDEPIARIGSDIPSSSGTIVDEAEDKDKIQSNHGKARRPTKRTAPAKKARPEDPRIITLDSLGTQHSSAVTALKYYLVDEYADKRKKEIAPPVTFGTKAVNIPEQNNFNDCGVYVLGYMEQFFKEPDGFVLGILRREEPPWKIDGSAMRKRWRDLIFEEHAAYQQSQKEHEQRKSAKPKKKQPEAAETSPKPDAAPQAVSLVVSAAQSSPATPRHVSPAVPALIEATTASRPAPADDGEAVAASDDASATTPTAAPTVASATAPAPAPFPAPTTPPASFPAPTTPSAIPSTLAPAAPPIVAPNATAVPPGPPESALVASPGVPHTPANVNTEAWAAHGSEANSSLPSQKDLSIENKKRRSCQPDLDSLVVCVEDDDEADVMEGDASFVVLDGDEAVFPQTQGSTSSRAQRPESRPVPEGVHSRNEIAFLQPLPDGDSAQATTPNRALKAKHMSPNRTSTGRFTQPGLLGPAPDSSSSPSRPPAMAASSPKTGPPRKPRMSLDSVEEVSSRGVGGGLNGDTRSSSLWPRRPAEMSRNPQGKVSTANSLRPRPRGGGATSHYFESDGSLRPSVVLGATTPAPARTGKADPIDLTGID